MAIKENPARFPPLHPPSTKIADPGEVRVGDNNISDWLPLR